VDYSTRLLHVASEAASTTSSLMLQASVPMARSSVARLVAAAETPVNLSCASLGWKDCGSRHAMVP